MPKKEDIFKNNEEWKRLEKIIGARKQKCFYNTWKVALIDNSYKYYEGYAMGFIPTEHAWVVDKHGKIFDPTYRLLKDYEPKEYLGVEIPIEFVTKQHRKEMWCEPRIHEYWESVK